MENRLCDKYKSNIIIKLDKTGNYKLYISDFVD